MAEEFFFGLDLSSFSADKKKKLQDFIALFERINKYDGKKITPIFGDGLAAFNTSLKETKTLLDDIIIQISVINSKKINPQFGQGGKSPMKDFGDQSDDARKKVKNLNDDTLRFGDSAKKLGKELTSALSSLRLIAYVLPGIGLAGIFNLAFEALTKVLQEFDLLGGKEIKQIEFTNKMNDAGLQLLETYKRIGEQSKNLFQFTPNTAQDLQRQTKLLGSEGQSPDKIFEKEISDLKIRQARADFAITKEYGKGTVVQHLIDENNQRNLEIENNAQEINSLQAIIAGGNKVSSSTAKVENLKGKNQKLQFDYDIADAKIKEYYKSREDLATKQAEFDKFNADQERKRVFETTKDNLAVIIQANQAIINDARSTKDEKLNAIEEILKADRKLAEATAANVLTNISTPPKERRIAENKLRDDKLKADEKAYKDSDNVLIEFYQRFTKAKADIDKSDLEKDAIENEKIYKNETNSLSKRLKAYANYIIDKQEMQRIELERDIQAGKNGPAGIGSDTKEEKEAKFKESSTLKANIQADAEKQVYDIVSTSLQKQLKLIIDINNLEVNDTKKAYTLELIALNKSFDDKKIKYQKWAKERAAIDEKYRRLGLDQDIINDKDAIFRLQELLRKEESLKISNDQQLKKSSIAVELNQSGLGGDELILKRKKDAAIGNQKAINDAILKLKEELNNKENQLTDDELKRAKEKVDKLKGINQKYYELAEKIVSALANLATSIIDQQAANHIARLEDMQRATDQYYDNNIAAIDKSTLSEKRKTALDIQLNEQKLESDKNAALQEREIKHKQAIADKEIGIAKATISTAIAVAAALEIPIIGEFLAAEKAILGAIEIATIAATPIPYAEGTPIGGHPGGLAHWSEGNTPEIVKKPYESPYISFKDTIGVLPKGTEVIPILDSPDFNGGRQMSGWEQTRWLAQQLKGNTKQTRITNIINIDLGFESYKAKVLGNG